MATVTVSVKVAGRKGATFAGFAHPAGELVSVLALAVARELGLAAGSVALFEVSVADVEAIMGAATPAAAEAAILASRSPMLPTRTIASIAWLLATGRPVAAASAGGVLLAGGGPAAAAGADAGEIGTETFDDLVAKLAAVALASPGASPKRGLAALFADGLASFSGGPPFVAVARVGADGLAWTSMAPATAADYEHGLFTESTFYRALTLHCPPWVELLAERTSRAKMNAVAIFGAEPPSRRVALPWNCEPGIFVRARAGHPGFNAEVKTAGDRRALEEVTMYVAMDMASSLFRNSDSAYYATPPVGYGLVACAHVGYFVSVEWVGVFHVAPVSEPFFLGSEAHRAAVAALRDVDFGAPVDIGAVAGWAHHGTARTVAWTTRPAAAAGSGQFLKLIWADAFAPAARAARFRQLHEAYAAYARAFADAADPPPRALLPARLLFGQFSVVAELRFFAGGRAATAEELTDARGPVLRKLARAVAWLARHALLHADIRAPNVLVAEGGGDGEAEGEGEPEEGQGEGGALLRVALVDYDDVIVLERAPATFAELDAGYRSRGVACWLALGALRSLVERAMRS